MQLKEDDIVMCSVKSIEGTTIFLQIEGSGSGSMVMSEVAAGRIRNLREYVYPNKKIVCKVLKILPDNIQLSLRRVTAKEREDIQARYKKERTFQSILKAVFENPSTIIEKIREKYDFGEFFDKARIDPKILENFMKKSEAETLSKLIAEKEEREKTVKKTILIKSLSDSGINDIREILSVKDKSVIVKYLGSSQFSLEAKGSDFKDAAHKVSMAIASVESKAKEKKVLFELKEK